MHYDKYGKSVYWGTPEFVENIMVAALYWNYLHPNSYIAFNDISAKNGGRLRPHATHRDGIDVDLKIIWDGKDITDCKSKINLIYKHNPLYASEGRFMVQEFVNLIHSVYPNKFNEIIWFDSRMSGLYYKVYQNNPKAFKLKYEHSNHIHLGY